MKRLLGIFAIVMKLLLYERLNKYWLLRKKTLCQEVTENKTIFCPLISHETIYSYSGKS